MPHGSNNNDHQLKEINESLLNHLFLPFYLPSSSESDFCIRSNHRNEYIILESVNEFFNWYKSNDNNNNIRTDVDSPDYQEKFAKEFAQTRAVLTHLCKQASNDADYQAKYNAAGIDSVQKLFNFSAGIIQGMINSGKVFDVFLQYQWSLKGDKTKTFLELPKNLKYGYFLAPDSSGQKWNEVKPESNLYYENERGERHIFERAKNFLDSPLAAEQNTGGKNQDAMVKQANAMNATTGKSDSKNWL